MLSILAKPAAKLIAGALAFFLSMSGINLEYMNQIREKQANEINQIIIEEVEELVTEFQEHLENSIDDYVYDIIREDYQLINKKFTQEDLDEFIEHEIEEFVEHYTRNNKISDGTLVFIRNQTERLYSFNQKLNYIVPKEKATISDYLRKVFIEEGVKQ